MTSTSSQYSGFSTDSPELSTFNVPNGKTTLNRLINYSYTYIVWLMYVHQLIMFVTSVCMLETCVDMLMLYDPIPVSHVYLI